MVETGFSEKSNNSIFSEPIRLFSIDWDAKINSVCIPHVRVELFKASEKVLFFVFVFISKSDVIHQVTGFRRRVINVAKGFFLTFEIK